jgi:PAS domain S-box-containing protein
MPLTAVEELAVHTALDSIVSDSLRLVTFGLGILFLVLAVSHPFVLPAAKAIPLSSVAAVSATVFFLGFLRLGREATPTHLAHPIAVSICGLILVNSLLHLFLVPEPRQTTNLILFLIGAGLFLLSVRWLMSVVVVTWIGWGALVWMGPPSQGWIHFGFALFLATVLSVLVHMARLYTYRRLEHARLQGERDKNELAKLVQTARQSEERYRELFENSTDALVSFALDGMILEANREAELLWGYAREEAIGQPFSKFITSASVELAQERILHALNGEEVPPLFELVGVRKDGSLVTIEGRSQFIRDAEQTPVAIQVAFRDVTDRKQAEEQQRRYAERLNILREIDHAIQMAQSLEAIAQAALPRLRQLVPCRRASVSLMDFSARESFLLAVDVAGETRFPTGIRLTFSSKNSLTSWKNMDK